MEVISARESRGSPQFFETLKSTRRHGWFAVHGGAKAHEGRRRGSTRPRLVGGYLEEGKARRGSAGGFRITPNQHSTDLSDARTLEAATSGSRLSRSAQAEFASKRAPLGEQQEGQRTGDGERLPGGENL